MGAIGLLSCLICLGAVGVLRTLWFPFTLLTFRCWRNCVAWCLLVLVLIACGLVVLECPLTFVFLVWVGWLWLYVCGDCEAYVVIAVMFY